MGKRGAKPKFIDISCPNQNCKFYGVSGKGNIIVTRLNNATIK